jgi:hypothetical protein
MDDADRQGGYDRLLSDIVTLLDQARVVVARNVNTVMTAERWCVGHRIVADEQAGLARATYGAETIEQLAADLTVRYGRGYSAQNLYLMRQFRLAWPPHRILQSATGESVAVGEPKGCEPWVGLGGVGQVVPVAVDRVCAVDGGEERLRQTVL